MANAASVIIPAYNESKSIAKVLNGLKGKGYEVIVVDDGSNDGTHKIVTGLGFRCIRISGNRGKGYACRTGVEKAKGEDIVIFDADDQFDARDIPAMLNALESNVIVVGERDMMAVPFRRRLSNRFAASVIGMATGWKSRDVLCGFRAAKRRDFLKLGLEKDRYEFESEMVLKAARKGMEIRSVPVGVRYFRGSCGISPLSSLKITLYIIKEMLIGKR